MKGDHLENQRQQENLAIYHANENFLLHVGQLASDYGKAASKSAMIINGGAAIALLAFLGNIWTGGVTELTNYLVDGFRFFSFGVLCAAVGVFTGYLATYINYQVNQKTIRKEIQPEILKITFLKYITISPWKYPVYLRIISMMLIGISFLLFYLGVSESSMAFTVDLSSECNNDG